MKFLKDVSRLVASENLPVTWTTPKPLNLAELNMNNPEHFPPETRDPQSGTRGVGFAARDGSAKEVDSMD